MTLQVGVAATTVFVVAAGATVLLGTSDDTTPAVFRMLNQRKYPASPLFLLMTLGPSIALLPLAERARGLVADVLATFGRVPLFYYLLHIPLIHVTALAVWFLRDGAMNAQRFSTAPFVSIPEPERWGLPLLYLVVAIDVTILYFACGWYARLKAQRPRAWMRYV